MGDLHLLQLVLLWDVCDAAKSHVTWMHLFLTGAPQRRAHRKARADETFRALRAALKDCLCPHTPTEQRQPPMAEAYLADASVAALLVATAEAAKVYAIAQRTYADRGTGRRDRDAALVALCKELDIVTFYRNGPVVLDTDEDGEPLPLTESTP